MTTTFSIPTLETDRLILRAPHADDLPRMIVDRPFLLTIRDRASGALIFFGRIADPTPVEQAQ